VRVKSKLRLASYLVRVKSKLGSGRVRAHLYLLLICPPNQISYPVIRLPMNIFSIQKMHVYLIICLFVSLSPLFVCIIIASVCLFVCIVLGIFFTVFRCFARYTQTNEEFYIKSCQIMIKRKISKGNEMKITDMIFNSSKWNCLIFANDFYCNNSVNQFTNCAFKSPNWPDLKWKIGILKITRKAIDFMMPLYIKYISVFSEILHPKRSFANSQTPNDETNLKFATINLFKN